jgi:hypothetical protein
MRLLWKQEDSVAKLLTACEAIQKTPGVFEKVRQNIVRRCYACNEFGGDHFEQFLRVNSK